MYEVGGTVGLKVYELGRISWKVLGEEGMRLDLQRDERTSMKGGIQLTNPDL